MNRKHELPANLKNHHYFSKTKGSLRSVFNDGTQRTGNYDTTESFPRPNVQFNFGNVQTKLEVSRPENIYEQQADRVAEQIINSKKVDLSGLTKSNEIVDGKCRGIYSEEENKEKMKISRKERNTKFEISDDWERDINYRLSESGSPLDTTTREFMEPRFGYDFSNITNVFLFVCLFSTR